VETPDRIIPKMPANRHRSRGKSKSPNRFSGLEVESDTEMDTGTSTTVNPPPQHKAKDEEVPGYIKGIMDQLAGLTETVKDFKISNERSNRSLATLVDKIASMQLQITDLKSENEKLKGKWDILEKRIASLEETPAPKSYSAAVEHGLPPKPMFTANNNNQKLPTKPVKTLQSPYPRASREVIVTFNNANMITTGQKIEDQALEAVNNALVKTAVQKRIFHGARFSLSNNLIFTTGLHDTNENLAGYLTTIEDSVKFIGIGNAALLAPWTKFLLHGVPTQLDLATIRRDVENYCPGVKLGQTPRWLATEQNRKDKPASTIVLAFIGKVSFSELGGRTIRVGNRSCNLTKYIQFGQTTQCTKCQSFGHPKEFCQAGPRCAVCAGNHLTAQHECPTKSCKGGYQCLHQELKW
jgi:hypothetical protein